MTKAEFWTISALFSVFTFLYTMALSVLKQPFTPPPSVQEATLHLMCADSRKLDSVRNKLYTCSVHRNKHD